MAVKAKLIFTNIRFEVSIRGAVMLYRPMRVILSGFDGCDETFPYFQDAIETLALHVIANSTLRNNLCIT